MVSHGGTSEYLNPRVHRPILQFSCLDRRAPRRYLGYTGKSPDELNTLSDDDLQQLLDRATTH